MTTPPLKTVLLYAAFAVFVALLANLILWYGHREEGHPMTIDTGQQP